MLCELSDMPTEICHHCRSGAPDLGEAPALIERDEE